MSRALPDAGYFERIPIQDPLGEDVEDIPAVDRYRFACRHVRGLRVLDIACGTGYGSVLLREAEGAEHVLGVDLAEEALAEARRFASPGRIEFAQGSAERIPLGDGSVDAVVTLETIEHVDDPERFLGEICRVLRPEGVCIVSTPLNESESRFRPPNPFHVREYTQAEFRELLGRHFEGVELWFQVSNFRDDPAWETVQRVSGGSGFRALLRGLVPPAGRSLVRRAMCSPGLHCVGSEFVDTPGAHATNRIALCRRPSRVRRTSS